MPLVVVDHPLAQHYLAGLRDEATSSTLFRVYCRKLSTIIAIEASRDFACEAGGVKTPMGYANVSLISDEIVVVPILRAGLGMLDAVVDLLPGVAVGYIGLERDERTAVANTYYHKLPDVKGRTVVVVDPMLATGGSALHAIERISSEGPKRIIMLCVVAAPEGVALLNARFPDLHIYTAALDDGLDARKYILPGLGDFGDRLYGT